jgi:hypothetical protein
MKEKELLLGRAVAENWILCFAHDAEIQAATVRRENGRVVMDRRVKL